MARVLQDKATARDEPTLEQAVLRLAAERPELGQARVAQELARLGYAVSASGVRYIWSKHGLETTYKRLKAIGKAAPLTEGQRAVLRRGEVSRKAARKAGLAALAGAASDERRAQVLFAAAELFVRHGYSGTSIRDIAQRVGLLPGSVYHYFPSKEDLFVAVQREGFEQLMARIDQAVRRGASARERLELACAEHIDAVVGDDPIARVTVTGLFAIHEDALQRRMKKDRGAYDEVFRRLVQDLSLPAHVDRSVFRLSLLGALNWTRVWYRPGGKTPRQIARHLMDIFCPG
ncbi:MAG: TetR/AcrR family transcriptional regulator [Pseudomonadota bacterium]|jgi:AcrR family transcriptional regulator